jgi:chromosome segregation protein
VKLRSLQLHGFKSFADRTLLEFRDGVTAIVGSNGCGKSNVADAVRWVLGEQRASAVRGAKMDEVIFAGSARRRPLAFAEATLRFENEAGEVAIPQREIEVTRRVFREGGSEYGLNRVACRLRDVQELFRDTGLGAGAPFVIEMGMVDAILSDRAEERRILFEEAAGIGRYKDHRRSTARRLEAAEADVARLVDLLGEVESQVRGLARQRKRAARHAEIQARRMELEVLLAHGEIEGWEAALASLGARLSLLAEERAGAAAERATAEAAEGARRTEAAGLIAERSAGAAALERLGGRLQAREREVIVADERRAHAEMRIAQLVRERTEQGERAAARDSEAKRLEGELDATSRVLGETRVRLERCAVENAALRQAAAVRRHESEAAVGRALVLLRETTAAAGELAQAGRRRDEIGARAARLDGEDERIAAEAARLDAELRNGSERIAALGAALAEQEQTGTDRAREPERLRRREREIRDALRTADDAAERLAAQVAARDALEKGYGGFAPAAAALMGARERFGGVFGPLADYLSPGEAEAAITEAYLGPLLHAVVVGDLSAAREIRRWFREDWRGGGGLTLLPLDAPGLPVGADGTAWAERLLEGVRGAATDDLLREYAPGPRVDPHGDLRDARGVIRLAERSEAEGILARRALLARLRDELRTAEGRRAELREARDRVRGEREQVEQAEHARREARGSVEVAFRRAADELSAAQSRLARLEREAEALRRERDAAREQAAALAAALASGGERLAELRRHEEAARREEAAATAARMETDASWERARDGEAELRVSAARAESRVQELGRQRSSASAGAEAARRRLATIDAEAAELRGSLRSLSGVRERAGGEMEALFSERDRASALLASLEARLGDLEREGSALEERSRVARRREAAASEERHRLELERAEVEARCARARERLEAEWAKPWETLASAVAPGEGEPDAWRAELRGLATALESLGPINMLAAEEHVEEERRLAFLREQHADLLAARADLAAAVREIDRVARDLFQETFSRVREHFHATFQSLFQGGECDVWMANPEAPLESPIEIHASPRGKRTQRIGLLSGGERTLAALSLLFAIYLVKPSPFCLFDEVDAPLDEANVGRFVRLLDDFKAGTQFIVITHNPRTMEAADHILGVTMEEPGVSVVVGVELAGVWESGERVA